MTEKVTGYGRSNTQEARHLPRMHGCMQQVQRSISLTTLLLCSAAEMMVDVVKQSRTCRKPSMQELSSIVAPMGVPRQCPPGRTLPAFLHVALEVL